MLKFLNSYLFAWFWFKDNIINSQIERYNYIFDTYLTYVALTYVMSDRKDESGDIESAQKNQKKIGAAEDDPETTGPAENLREEAAEMVDEDEESKEPA